MVWSYGLVWSGLVWSGLVWSGQVWSGLVWSGLVWSGLVWSNLKKSGVWQYRDIQTLTDWNVGILGSRIPTPPTKPGSHTNPNSLEV